MNKFTSFWIGSISQQKISELWKLKLLVYALRDSSWIRQSAFVPLLALLIDIALSQFNRNVILISLLMSLAYVTLSVALFTKIRSMQAKIKTVQNPYPMITFLHNIFDLATLIVITASSFLLGVIMLSSQFVTEFPLQILFVLLLLTFLVSLLLTPKLVNSKSLSRVNDNKANTYTIALLPVLTAVPGFFVFLSALLLQSGRVEVAKALVGFVAYAGTTMLIPYLVTGSLELILLVKNWPEVKRTGSEFLL